MSSYTKPISIYTVLNLTVKGHESFHQSGNIATCVIEIDQLVCTKSHDSLTLFNH